MNNRVRVVKTSLDLHKEMIMEDERNKLQKGKTNKRLSRRERKLALIQDVDKLKKKLRHEENVHKVLERAINRPLGALPRLPPYLHPHTLELVAEVAVLEEEVVRLEEEVVTYRKGLYQEAVHTASKKIPDLIVLPKKLINNKQEDSNSISRDEENRGLQTIISSATLARSASSRRLMSSNPISDQDNTSNCLNWLETEKQVTNNFNSPLEDARGKKNKSCPNSAEDKIPITKTIVKRPPRPQIIAKYNNPHKSQLESRLVESEQAQESSSSSSDATILEVDSIPNKLSEDILNCLCTIFLRLGTPKDKFVGSKTISSIFPISNENNQKAELRDPYFCGLELREMDIGPYKHLYSIQAGSIDLKRKTNASFLINRLKILLGKLASINLEGLTHQQKLAFWINTYNSCMMNAVLEKGISETPEMVVELLQKATIVVAGNLLNALTIEHFILRLPNHLKYPCSKKVARNDQFNGDNVFGLEWSEPLITFALSCGSRSSPAVRIYTASQVENQLEAAKRDYLQAAISISISNKIIIPKLLDWYLLDFAKDLEALLDWVCLELPDELRNEAIKILENKKGTNPLSQSINIIPHDFSFRYLICR